jgi:hypothetical protein
LFEIAAHARQRRQLQGDLAVERAVGALREPHFGHAAGAQQPDQLVRADAIAGLKPGGLGASGFIVCGGFQEGSEVPSVRRLMEFRQQRLTQCR